MSMYTQLLNAAVGQEPGREHKLTRDVAVSEARRCHEELLDGAPPGLDPDTVPVVLALEIGYDVALIRLAGLLGIETDPGRFEQPARERKRLEERFDSIGITLGEQSAKDAANC